jgi:hypothetical protein
MSSAWYLAVHFGGSIGGENEVFMFEAMVRIIGVVKGDED